VGFRANASNGTLTNAGAIGANATVSVSNALVLGNGANVGIGTSSPTSRLHVSSGTANQSGLRLENLTSASPASLTNQTKFLSVDGSGNVVLASSNSSARVGAEELWQLSSGRLQPQSGVVVIGDGIEQTPAGYKLFVGGGILTEKLKVSVANTASWSDRVFERGYRLRSLGEVSAYINEHGHLPGVPSAGEVVAQGVDVGQMQAKLLEKVEELTLYILQLKEANHKLTEQNKQMMHEHNKLKVQVSKMGQRK